MLALAAAQLKFQAHQGLFKRSKPIWVDVSRLVQIQAPVCSTKLADATGRSAVEQATI